jgi:hypothetical protein
MPYNGSGGFRDAGRDFVVSIVVLLFQELEVVQVLAPAPDVAIAFVRRVALDADGKATTPTTDPSGHFPRWRSTSWCNATGHGGWPAARTHHSTRCPPDGLVIPGDGAR